MANNPFGKMPGNLGGLGNLGNLMKQMQKATEDARKLDEELGQARITAQSGGGAVTAVVTGKAEMVEIKISKEAVDPNDVETLEDLVTLAVREAIEKANAEREAKLQSIVPPGIAGGLQGGGLGGLF